MVYLDLTTWGWVLHPLWALTVITVDALVIWALTARGSELRSSS